MSKVFFSNFRILSQVLRRIVMCPVNVDKFDVEYCLTDVVFGVTVYLLMNNYLIMAME
jgi:hypothetical protein